MKMSYLLWSWAQFQKKDVLKWDDLCCIYGDCAAILPKIWTVEIILPVFQVQGVETNLLYHSGILYFAYSFFN